MSTCPHHRVHTRAPGRGGLQPRRRFSHLRGPIPIITRGAMIDDVDRATGQPASLSPDASSRKRAERASDKRPASPSPDESLGYCQQSLLPRKPASPSLDASPAVSLPVASQPASPTTSTCATAPTPSWEGSSTRRADHRRQVPPPLYSVIRDKCRSGDSEPAQGSGGAGLQAASRDEGKTGAV